MSRRVSIILSILAIITLTIVGCKKKDSINNNENLLESIRTIQQRIITSSINGLKEDLIKETETTANTISNNRSFVLSYFLDKSVTSPEVSGITKKYLKLLDLDGLILVDSNQIISSTGVTLSDSLLNNNILLTYENNRLLLLKKTPLTVGDGKISLIGIKLIDSTIINKIAKITGAPVIITLKNRTIISSNDLKINTLSKPSSKVIILNGVKSEIATSSLGDSLDIISLINTER